MDIKNKYFPVLDKGFVSLVDVMGGDASIVQAARVSYGKGTKKTSDDKNLIRYLIRHRHTTPVEMVTFKFHISMPIHCHRQFIRHRMSTTNEYSARYSEVPEVVYDGYTLATQSNNNKQGRSDDSINPAYEKDFNAEKHTIQTQSFELYNEMIESGVAREIARMHLPLNTYTYFYWKIDLHNLMHFLKLRCDAHAQWEIRQYANTLAGIVKATCPIAFEAWYDYVFAASTLTRLDKIFLSWYNSLDVVNLSLEERTAKCLEKAEEIGMTKREEQEFWAKITNASFESFDLDIEKAKDSSYFENLINNH